MIWCLLVWLPAMTACANGQAPDENQVEKQDGAKSGYVIVTDAILDDALADPFANVVNELAAHRKADAIINLNDGFEGVFEKLKNANPKYVAFVVKPERIEDNFVGAVFDGMANLDDDPQLDAAWGFITGRTADDALQVIRNTIEAEKDRAVVPKKFVAVAHTFSNGDLSAFATEQCAEFKKRGFETAGINPIDDSKEWQVKAQQEINKLAGASLVFLVGHGMGDLSCAISGDEFGKVKLNHAIVVNGTCHSAVTKTRHDVVDQALSVKAALVDSSKSVCLNFISAGAIAQIGSTASSSWMNVALAIDDFLNQGKSVGDALRNRLNLAIDQSGVKQVNVMRLRFAEGKPSPQFLGPKEDPGYLQSMARVVLIGDPAYVPYPIE